MVSNQAHVASTQGSFILALAWSRPRKRSQVGDSRLLRSRSHQAFKCDSSDLGGQQILISSFGVRYWHTDIIAICCNITSTSTSIWKIWTDVSSSRSLGSGSCHLGSKAEKPAWVEAAVKQLLHNLPGVSCLILIAAYLIARDS
jgi:hypothetical protein